MQTLNVQLLELQNECKPKVFALKTRNSRATGLTGLTCVTKADTAGQQLRHQERLYSMAAKGRERAEFHRMWAEVMGWEKTEWEG